MLERNRWRCYNLRRNRLIALIIAVAALLMIFQIANIWSDYMWFGANGQQHTFWVLFLTRYGVGLLAFIISSVFFGLNFWFIRRCLPRQRLREVRNRVIELMQNPIRRFLTTTRGTIAGIIASVVLGLLLAVQVGSNWQVVQKFIYGVPFGQVDPVFGRDVSFYIFSLPFYELLLTTLTTLFVIVLLIAAFIYFSMDADEFLYGGWKQFSPVKLHLGGLIAGLLVMKAWDYHLQIYKLMFSQHKAFSGIGYTDIHARIPALDILTVLALVAAVLVSIGIIKGRIKPIAIGIGGLIVASLLIGSAYPYLVQKFQVEPNEFSSERPYLINNMDATRAAYGLDKVKQLDSSSVTNGQSSGMVNQQVLDAHKATLTNLRLWDFRPLQQVYSQMQQLRRYYSFTDVDIDRYKVNGDYRQVMLSVRELDQNNLPVQAQTWVNKRLQYTHGFGAVMSPVNEMTPDGLPNYLLENIPPKASAPELTIKRPEIYYGELTTDMVVVNTKTGEFNYPSGENNVYSSYSGHGGVALSSAARRVAYALSFQDLRLLLSTDITSQSRILYNRTIQDASRLAPYLHYDSDPYAVISGGRIYWVWDAYTESDHYPYAESNGGLNYIRNSVKVVLDAYQGDINFYVTDPTDPLIKTYSKIYPGLYRPISQMPSDLRAHIRYPEDLFNVQTSVYALYHISDPRVFYNREDEWAIPNEKNGSTSQQMLPYYAVMQLPGNTKAEYVLVLPFTPVNRQNLVAWMAARCDGANYGHVVVDQFSKDVHAYGPMQVEASIDQDPGISGQLTLWNQKGSQVLRGNLITVPLAGKLLYVQPLFLQAEESSLPELTRVIVFYDGRVAMDKDLNTALGQIFNFTGQSVPSPATVQQTGPATPANLDQTALTKKANDLYQQALNAQRAGDWAGYGKAISDLGGILKQMIPTPVAKSQKP